MGNSDSKKKKEDKDDGCIGNRRVRTIILSLLLIAFAVFGLAYIFANQEIWADLQDLQSALPDDLQVDYIKSQYHAWNIIASGAIITIAGAICAVVLFFIPNCEDNLGRVAGLVLIIGGLLYIIGWIWLVNAEKSALTTGLINVWDLLSDDAKRAQNAKWAAHIGEALLFGGSALLLGIDALLQWYEDEAKRLSSNFGLLMAVAIMCVNSYYLQICEEDPDLLIQLCVTPDGVEAIATGYLILFVTCLVYIILYICTCCTCNCKDNCLVRIGLAVALVIGGVLCSIGYYVYVGGYESAGTDDFVSKMVAFYIGYTILIAGLPIVWALDIALDDVKNSKNYSKK